MLCKRYRSPQRGEHLGIRLSSGASGLKDVLPKPAGLKKRGANRCARSKANQNASGCAGIILPFTFGALSGQRCLQIFLAMRNVVFAGSAHLRTAHRSPVLKLIAQVEHGSALLLRTCNNRIASIKRGSCEQAECFVGSFCK